MPTYSFESSDGEQIEEFFVAADRPAWGESIVRNGKSYVRIVDASGGFKRNFEHVSQTLPRWHPDAPYHIQSGPEAGKCCFETERQCEEFSAKNPRFQYNKDVG